MNIKYSFVKGNQISLNKYVEHPRRSGIMIPELCGHFTDLKNMAACQGWNACCTAKDVCETIQPSLQEDKPFLLLKNSHDSAAHALS